jgi:hypothetical protein
MKAVVTLIDDGNKKLTIEIIADNGGENLPAIDVHTGMRNFATKIWHVTQRSVEAINKKNPMGDKQFWKKLNQISILDAGVKGTYSLNTKKEDEE